MLLLYKDKIIESISTDYPPSDPDLIEIILFGSVARDDFTPLSDVDILLITNDRQATHKIFSEFTNQLFVETCVVISTKYLTPTEFESSIEPLYKTVKKEGKSLWKRKMK